jgi:hypothetical protein
MDEMKRHEFMYMLRSYFKCQRSNCCAKKKAEWSASDTSTLRVVYDGVHTHASPATESASSGQSGTSSSTANSYNLLTQVFGDRSSTTSHYDDHP